MGDPVPSSAISDATVGGLSLLVVSGGADGHVLTQQADGTYAPEAPSAASGDVVGPASSTDNALARYDATTGKLLQNCVVIVDDSGNISGLGTVSCASITSSGSVQASGAWASTNAALFGKGTWNGDAFINNDFYFENSVGFYIKTGDFIGITATTPNGATRSVRTRLSEASAGVWQVGTTANNALGSINLLNLTATGLICAGTYTVGTLPSASANAYKFATVSDSSVTTFGSTVAGSGSSKVMVYSNGTNWTVCAA